MDYINQINEAKELRQRNLKLMDDLTRSANKDNEVVNQEQWDKYLAEDKKLEDQIGKLEYLENRKAEQAAKEIEQRENKAPETSEVKDQKEEYRKVYDKYLRSGGRSLNAEEQNILTSGEVRGTGNQTAGTDAQGGYTIPEGFSNNLFVEMAAWGGVRNAATVMTTATGNLIPWPTVDDTSVTGALLTEGSTDTVSDLTFGEKSLNAYTYSSNTVKVSVQLLQDSAFNLPAFLSETFARRLGTITNLHYTTGDNSAKPNGFITAGTSGLTAASATAITRAELVQLIHSVDPAYRTGSQVGFMFNDSTLSAIKQLSIGSADDRPLWQPSVTAGEPDRLEGFQYWINQDMASIATTTKAVAFGDFSKYIIRDAGGVTAVRLNERYMDALLVGFMAYMRTDGELLSANAIKFITQA